MNRSTSSIIAAAFVLIAASVCHPQAALEAARQGPSGSGTWKTLDGNVRTSALTPAIAARLIGDVYSPFTWMRY